MGTRGLLGHIVRGKKLRKGAYNHFDSYPSGLGEQLAKFIGSLTDEQIEKMTEMVGKIEWIPDERTPAPKDVQDRYVAFGFADTAVGGQRTDDWYCLLRNVQGTAALPHILDSTLTHLVDSTSFEEDRLFCEWSYFVDWEERVVHVRGRDREGSVDFKELSAEWMIQFERGNKEDEEDEEDDA